MNTGIIRKAFREAFLTTVLVSIGLFIFEALVAWIFYTYQEQLTEDIMRIEFVRNIISSLVGADVAEQLGPGALRAMAWIHPIVLALLWAHTMIICTRLPAGEIDRGTIDILFALPASRWRIFGSETFVWMVTGVIIIGAAILGSLLGHQFVPADARPSIARLITVGANMYALHLAVGAMTYLFSTVSDRRGRAVGSAFGVVLFLFLWNFLTQYWSWADRTAFLNILTYYKPLPILDRGVFPWQEIAVLLCTAIPVWIAAGTTLARRDIATV